MNHKPRIVMTTMFRNESRVIRRMLESCAPHIDYWVIQDNGSTDGTDEIVREFFREHPIPGHLYRVEEGWKGFGWNRDHLVQTCQQLDHGCDWILKMDCDEVLEVDPDFDWNLLSDISIQAWNVPAVSGSCVYYRCWMWNARLPWRFNHDLCHETVYCELPEIDHNIQAANLPLGFRQLGYNEGQSWSVPTKFITDALLLEERMTRENTMLTDRYHFFYIGKSYNDGFRCSSLPLGRAQQVEYADRAIFFLDQWINYTLQDNPTTDHEMVYVALMMMADCYEFVEDLPAAVSTYRRARGFAPDRNDDLFGIARVYERMNRWDDMLAATSLMMQPERVCPFPRRSMFIDRNQYHDQGPMVAQLHQRALTLAQSQLNQRLRALGQTPAPTSARATDEDVGVFAIHTDTRSRLWIVDDFYADPDSVRRWALAQEFQPDIRWYKGMRSTRTWRPDNLRRRFEQIIGQPIEDWEGGYNGVFQITTASDPQVYHNDTQRWAAMIYLTPDAPVVSGTRLHRSRETGVSHLGQGQQAIDDTFRGDFYDGTRFETVALAGNVYNRLVIMDAQHIHSAGDYFGNDAETGRLVHLFFFD